MNFAIGHIFFEFEVKLGKGYFKQYFLQTRIFGQLYALPERAKKFLAKFDSRTKSRLD
jgi:hypothetical protein